MLFNKVTSHLCLIYHCFCFSPFNVITRRKVTVAVISAHPGPHMAQRRTWCPAYLWISCERRDQRSLLRRGGSQLFFVLEQLTYFSFLPVGHGVKCAFPAGPEYSVATPHPRGPREQSHPNHTQGLLYASSFHFYLEGRLSWCYWNVSPLSRTLPPPRPLPPRVEAPNAQMSPHLQGFHLNFKCKWLHPKHQLPTQTPI